jgi:hypothetical protein
VIDQMLLRALTNSQVRRKSRKGVGKYGRVASDVTRHRERKSILARRPGF